MFLGKCVFPLPWMVGHTVWEAAATDEAMTSWKLSFGSSLDLRPGPIWGGRLNLSNNLVVTYKSHHVPICKILIFFTERRGQFPLGTSHILRCVNGPPKYALGIHRIRASSICLNNKNWKQSQSCSFIRSILLTGSCHYFWTPARPAIKLARRGLSIQALIASLRLSFDGGKLESLIHWLIKESLACTRFWGRPVEEEALDFAPLLGS